MEDFNLKKFLIENKMTRNSQLLSENRDSEYLPLAPEVIEFIDERVEDVRDSDQDWEYLKDVEFWQDDFHDELLTHFMEDFPNAYRISKEVEDYIDSKIYGEELEDEELDEIKDKYTQQKYQIPRGEVFDAIRKNMSDNDSTEYLTSIIDYCKYLLDIEERLNASKKIK